MLQSNSLLGERSSDAVPCSLQAASDAAVGRSLAGTAAALRSRRVGFVGKVASTAAADVVDGSLVLHHLALALELLVEAEDGSLLRVVHVASTAAAGGIVWSGVCGGWVHCALESGARGWASGISASCDRLGVDVGDVAGSSTARVDVVGGGDGRMGLSDAVG